jgi:hypothetical protein
MKAYWWMGCRITQLTLGEAEAALAALSPDPASYYFYILDAIERRIAHINAIGGPNRPDNPRFMAMARLQ